MKRTTLPLLFSLALAGLTATAAQPKKVLVVTVTTGFRHSSIPTAEKVLAKLAQQSGAFTIDLVQQPPDRPSAPKRPAAPPADADAATQQKFQADLARFEAEQARFKEADAKWQETLRKELARLGPDNLKKYDGVIFANTTGNLPIPDPEAFIQWIRDGGAFIGMHSATDTFHGFRPFIDMIGGEFQSHGAQVTVDCLNEDRNHPACKHLSSTWTVHDEIYIFKNFTRGNVHGLLSLDKEPNRKTPGDYPVAWCKQFGQGKVFYTSLGHREDIWDDDTPPNFKRQNSKEIALAYQEHILNGIKWALGLVPGDATPQRQ